MNQKSILSILAILFIGALFTYFHWDLPIIRHSITYQSAIENFLREDVSFLEFAQNRYYNNTKPIGYSLFALPFNQIFGMGHGLLLSTYFCISIYILCCLYLYQNLKDVFNLNNDQQWIYLLLIFLNPLMIYQFHAASSDGLFACFFLLCSVFSLKVFHQKEYTPKNIALMWLFAYLAIHIRYIGITLFMGIFIYSVYDFLKGRILKDMPKNSKITFISISSVLSCLIFLSFIGYNPTLNFQVIVFGERGINVPGNELSLNPFINLLAFIGFMAIIYQIFLLNSFEAIKEVRKKIYIFILPLTYLLTLILFYSATKATMRLVIPALPFISLALLASYQKRKHLYKQLILINYIALAPILIISLNHPVFASKWQSKINFYKDDGFFDDLRAYQKVYYKERFSYLNKEVPLTEKTFIITDYYADHLRELLAKLGHIHKDRINHHFVDTCNEIPENQKNYTLLFFGQLETIENCKKTLDSRNLKLNDIGKRAYKVSP